MTKHTDKHFEEELNELKEEISRMGAMVEEMLALASKALVEGNSHIARDVIKKDPGINRYELIIDDHCLEILVKWQPAASDLRFITIGLRISKDLERIGDLAVDISEQVLELNRHEKLKPYKDLEIMAEKTKLMVQNALDSFIKQDTQLARKVCSDDDEVDALKRKVFQDLITLMENDQELVSRGTRVIIVSRHMERIADHATNIAEEVIFMIEGKDIRHIGKS